MSGGAQALVLYCFPRQMKQEARRKLEEPGLEITSTWNTGNLSNRSTYYATTSDPANCFLTKIQEHLLQKTPIALSIFIADKTG